MRARIRWAAETALVPSVALGVALVALPGRAALLVHVWLLTVLAIALGSLVVAVRDQVPAGSPLFDAALRRRTAPPVRPPSLARIERELSMGSETAFDTHARLRPLFRDLAGSVLLTHHGVDLGRSPERARALVGHDLWALVRPDAELPEDRSQPGLPRAAVERAVSDLERLACG